MEPFQQAVPKYFHRDIRRPGGKAQGHFFQPFTAHSQEGKFLGFNCKHIAESIRQLGCMDGRQPILHAVLPAYAGVEQYGAAISRVEHKRIPINSFSQFQRAGEVQTALFFYQFGFPKAIGQPGQFGVDDKPSVLVVDFNDFTLEKVVTEFPVGTLARIFICKNRQAIPTLPPYRQEVALAEAGLFASAPGFDPGGLEVVKRRHARYGRIGQRQPRGCRMEHQQQRVCLIYTGANADIALIIEGKGNGVRKGMAFGRYTRRQQDGGEQGAFYGAQGKTG